MAARRDRADENTLLLRAVHAQPVAQHCAARERRRRVDRQHAHRMALRSGVHRQAINQRRLAGAGRPGNADDVAVAGARPGRL